MSTTKIELPSEKLWQSIPPEVREEYPELVLQPHNYVIYIAKCPDCNDDAKWFGLRTPMGGTKYWIDHIVEEEIVAYG